MSKVQQLKTFVNEVVVESKKVTWPGWEDLKSSTWVVIVAVAFITFFITVVDRVVSMFIGLIL
jgi:preprotein translocase subunit SecE